MIHIIFWLVFGALVGWVAAILRGTTTVQGTIVYVLSGALGGVCGGVCGLLLSPDIAAYDSQASGLTFAVVGAIASVAIVRYADSHYSS